MKKIDAYTFPKRESRWTFYGDKVSPKNILFGEVNVPEDGGVESLLK
jgi:lipid-binding SYLF domain-containing protein